MGWNMTRLEAMVSVRISLGLGLNIGLLRVMIRVNPLVPNPAFDSIDPLYPNRPYTALKFYIQISGSTMTQSGEYFGNQFYVHWRCNGTTRVLSIIPCVFLLCNLAILLLSRIRFSVALCTVFGI